MRGIKISTYLDFFDAHENAPIRKIVPKGKKENAPIFQNNKK